MECTHTHAYTLGCTHTGAHPAHTWPSWHLQKSLQGRDSGPSPQGSGGRHTCQVQGPSDTRPPSHRQAHLASGGSSFFSWKWPISLRSKAIQLCGSVRPSAGMMRPRGGTHPHPSSPAHTGWSVSTTKVGEDDPGWPFWGRGPPSAHPGFLLRQRALSVRGLASGPGREDRRLGGGTHPAAHAPAMAPQGLDGGPDSSPSPQGRSNPAPHHLALILRGGREEPRAVLLADVGDLEGEDVAGCRLLSCPHHPEGSASGHHAAHARRDGPSTAPPLDRTWHPAPRPEGHGKIWMVGPLSCWLKAWMRQAEGSVWARVGSERRAQGSRRASREQRVQGSETRTCHPRCPPMLLYLDASGPAWPLAYLLGTLMGLVSPSALPLLPGGWPENISGK